MNEEGLEDVYEGKIDATESRNALTLLMYTYLGMPDACLIFYGGTI